MHPLIGIFFGGLLPLAAALGLGRAAWRGRGPHWTLELASGSALLSTLLFALLAARAAYPAAVLPLCVVCALPLLARRPALACLRVPLWMAALMAVYAAYYLVHALAPEIQPDAAGYHLGLVADWARRHGMPARTGFYEMLPLGLETLFYPAYLAGGPSAAKLVHFGYFLATIPLLLWIGGKLNVDSRASLAAAGLYFFTPVAGISGSCAYNDAAEVFFSLAAFGLLLEVREGKWNALFHAGLAAGFAYAVKLTGAVVAAGVTAWAALRHGRRGLAVVAAGVILAAGAWPARNLVLVGNPLAPLGNRIFPNDHFHAASEEHLSRTLASYGGLRWHQAPKELAFGGARLQGVIGPAVFLLPLALLSLRRPEGRIALLAGTVLLTPWLRNLGARFLMPALPVLFLAIALWTRPRWMQALFALQAIVCSPWAVEAYADRLAWRLHGLPWKAALRLEPEKTYLRQHLYEYGFVEKAAPRIGRDGLLDLYGLPYAYLETAPLGPLSSARFDNAALALQSALGPRPERIAVLRANTDGRFLRAVRVRLEADWPGLWSIQEVGFQWRSRRVPVSKLWLLDAQPNAGDAWLAVDGNPATRWFTWDGARAGAWWELRFARPRPVDAVVIRTLDAQPRPPVSLRVQTLDRRWEDLTSALERKAVARRLWRRDAVRFLRSLGIRWIAVATWSEGYGAIGRSMLSLPAAWGVEPVLVEKGIVLFRIRD
ncbi:MAG: phospholipid carrier-dependent glycosyltransferase [Bryobacteraceae bacterium]